MKNSNRSSASKNWLMKEWRWSTQNVVARDAFLQRHLRNCWRHAEGVEYLRIAVVSVSLHVGQYTRWNVTKWMHKHKLVYIFYSPCSFFLSVRFISVRRFENSLKEFIRKKLGSHLGFRFADFLNRWVHYLPTNEFKNSSVRRSANRTEPNREPNRTENRREKPNRWLL